MKLLIISYFFLTVLFSSCSEKHHQQFSNPESIDYNENLTSQCVVFDKCFTYFEKIFPSIVALIGIIFTIPILKRKLIESHVSNKLNEIQISNTKLQVYNQRILDKYYLIINEGGILSRTDLENSYKDIQSGFEISLNSCSEATTLMYYLRNTIQKTYLAYNQNILNRLSTHQFLSFVINILELVSFYSTRVIQIPKSHSILKNSILKKSVRKYVTNPDYFQFRYFKQGIDNSPRSALFLLFTEKVIHTEHSLLMRSSFQIHNSPRVIALLLFFNKIYVPPTISKPIGIPLFGIDSYKLYLIGFSFYNEVFSDRGSSRKFIKLFYSNVQNKIHFVKSLVLSDISKNFSDNWLIESNFKMDKVIDIHFEDFESISLDFDYEYVKNQFMVNGYRFKKSIK